MIGFDPTRTRLLSAAFASTLLALPALAAAQTAPLAPSMTVTLVDDGTASAYRTQAATVGAFLAERNATAGPGDRLSVPAASPLRDGESIDVRHAANYTVVDGAATRTVRSLPGTVAQVLAAGGIRLGPHDGVTPDANVRATPATRISVSRAAAWTATRRESIAADAVVYRADPKLPYGRKKTLSAGRRGEREISERFVRGADGRVVRRVLASRIVRAPEARVIARGIGEYAAFSQIARRGFASTMHMAGTAMHMVATAYTAGCAGCSGRTSLGMAAGHGVVAVDPRVIPLGTRLFIPGYGRAVAGDTGGAIKGRRMDLGFDRLRDALLFGRREITVIILPHDLGN